MIIPLNIPRMHRNAKTAFQINNGIKIKCKYNEIKATLQVFELDNFQCGNIGNEFIYQEN